MKPLLNLIIILLFGFSLAKAQPGSIDWSFDTDFDMGGQILKIEFQPDGKIILAGAFGVKSLDKNFQHILRLNTNGTLDLSCNFNGAFDGRIKSMVTQKDGKIIVTGNFRNFNNYPCETITRVNLDGTIDTSFHLSSSIYGMEVLAMQADNKILGADYKSIIRMNNNGSIDTSFKKLVTYDWIKSILVQSDGKILVGGSFTYPKRCLVRLNKDGSLDSSFNTGDLMGINGIRAMSLQADGNIILAGYKTPELDNLLKGPIRLYPSGKLDSNFNSKGGLDKNNFITSIFIQKDGKIIIGGFFTSFNGISTNNILRLNKDGSFDTTFKIGSGFDATVDFISQKEEGKILVSCEFTSYDNFLSSGIISLNIKDESFLKISISPNPSIGIFTVNSSQSIKKIIITDAVGKEILRYNPMTFDTEIDLTDKSPGLYFITSFSDGESLCQKILKQ